MGPELNRPRALRPRMGLLSDHLEGLYAVL